MKGVCGVAGIGPEFLRSSLVDLLLYGLQALEEGFLADGRFFQEWDISERPDKALSVSEVGRAFLEKIPMIEIPEQQAFPGCTQL